MRFYMPTRVYYEEGCVAAHTKELDALGTAALVVTGRSSAKKCGALDDVTSALLKNGITYMLFDEVEENPSVETVMKAARLAKESTADIDFVIGVGGGSAIDAAKAIALMIANPDKDAEFLCRGGVPHNEALPLAAVPTTCGTGSEATAVSVLTYHDRRTKGSIPFRIFPQLALCDGRYLKTAPQTLIANTAVDAFGHLVESYLNSAADDYSRMCAEKGLEVWSRSRGLLESEYTPDDTELRDLMTASTLAGMAIAHTGTGIPHGLSYALTYENGIAHGKAVGYFLGGFMSCCDKADTDRMLAMAGFGSIGEYERFFRKVCRAEPISADMAKLCADRLMETPKKLGTAPFAADKSAVKTIAERACEKLDNL